MKRREEKKKIQDFNIFFLNIIPRVYLEWLRVLARGTQPQGIEEGTTLALDVADEHLPCRQQEELRVNKAAQNERERSKKEEGGKREGRTICLPNLSMDARDDLGVVGNEGGVCLVAGLHEAANLDGLVEVPDEGRKELWVL